MPAIALQFNSIMLLCAPYKVITCRSNLFIINVCFSPFIWRRQIYSLDNCSLLIKKIKQSVSKAYTSALRKLIKLLRITQPAADVWETNSVKNLSSYFKFFCLVNTKKWNLTLMRTVIFAICGGLLSGILSKNWPSIAWWLWTSKVIRICVRHVQYNVSI